MKNKFANVAMRTSVLYAVVAGAWILLSGRMLFALVPNPELRVRLEIYKGWAFVAVTALLLYTTLRCQLRRLEREAAERKRTEEALRNSEEQHRAVLENQTEIISRFKPDHTYTFVNDAFCQFFGKTRQELLGRKWHPEVLPEDLPRVEQQVRSLSPANPIVLVENRMRSGSGEVRWMQFSHRALFDGQNRLIEIQSVGRDLTGRKLAEDVLRRNQAQLDEALRIARLAYWEYDVLEDRFTFNDQFYSILRTTAEREGGYTMSSAEYARRFVPPEDAATVGIEIQKAVASTDPNYSRESDKRIIYADGEVGYFSVHVRVQKDAQGRTIKTRGANMDITERKRVEQRLAESRNYLDKIINSVADPIFVKDRRHRCVLLNDACCDLVGRSREMLLGKPDHDIFPKNEADVFQSIDEAVFTTGKENTNEEEFTDARGNTHTIMTKKALYTDERGEKLIVGVIRDITERKRVEQDLEMYEFSIDQASDAIFWMTEDAGFSYVNEQACRSLGYTREELMRLRLWDIDPVFPKEVWDANWKQFREDKGGAQQVETLHRRKDGSVFPVSISSKHLWFGHTELHVAVARDITERKQAEETLVHERHLLRTLIDLLPETLYVKDLDSRFLVANETLAKRFGKEISSQVLGLSDADLFPVGLAAGFRAEELSVFAGEPLIDHEDSVVFPDGREHTVVTTKVPFRDNQGRVQGLVGIGRDITERKQAEEAHARLATAVEQAAEAIVITDPKGTILYTNPAFERITGYTSREVIGQNPRILKSGRHDDAFYQQMWSALSRGKVWTNRLINKKKNGALYEEETSISPVFDVNGKIINYVAVKRDVTQEVALETQLRQAQKMEIIGQLAGGVAHDFNNILTVIQGNASLLRNAGSQSDEEAECTQQIIEAAERAASLTRQLLMFSRKQVMQPADLNLNEIVAQMTKMLRRVLGENISLQSNYAANLPLIYGDIGMIEQVLMNLVVNARDAMPAGGCLTITTGVKLFDQKQAEQSPGASPGLHVWLAVSDSGSGITPEHLPRIFEPFFTTKEAGKGTGLGLATVYGIVQQHRGWITVASEVNQGTTFQIYFPAVANEEPEKKGGPRIAGNPRGAEIIPVREGVPPTRLSIGTVPFAEKISKYFP